MAAKRTCTVCRKAKPVSAFYVRNRQAGTFHAACKPCYLARQAEYKARRPHGHAMPPGGRSRYLSDDPTDREIQLRRIREQYEAGATIRQVGETVGCCYYKAVQLVHLSGAKVRPRGGYQGRRSRT